ncbi:MAG: hypothetical protein IT195_04675 [Microthrixaceae bacterium]|nr:hypothetical protein [Microthrixaceae bacterium]
MPAPLLERRLKMLSRRLGQLRADLALADEQLAHFADESDDARLRALVSETPLAEHEHREAERHSSAMARHRDDLVELIAKLESEQDALLDKLTSRRRS